MGHLRTTALAVLLGLLATTATATEPVGRDAGALGPTEAQELREIAVEAYAYAYPLVLMDTTRAVATNVERAGTDGRAPPDTFAHMRIFPLADFRDVVRPNFDTLYSTAWLDVAREPLVVSVPDTGGRWYLLQMMDMWTDVFATPGARTTGTKSGHFALVARGWKGKLPDGVAAIEAPTPRVWVLGRTQTDGIADYASVHRVQDGFRVTPLSRFGKGAAPPKGRVDGDVDMRTAPMEQVARMDAAAFFARFAEVLRTQPPHAEDWPVLARMKRLGIVPGRPFDLADAAPTVREALEKAVPEAQRRVAAKVDDLGRLRNGWSVATEGMGSYGADYLRRAAVARMGLGTNRPEDALYPHAAVDADGRPLTGANAYVLHFDAGKEPPARAFWSVTLYDPDGFPVANALERFALGDRDDLVRNADGSLDLYVQHASPGAAREANWLPAPKGPFALTMRIYGPAPEALDGRWVPPPVRRAATPARKRGTD